MDLLYAQSKKISKKRERGGLTLEKVGWRFLYLLSDVIHFSAASTVANLEFRKRKSDYMRKVNKYKNLQHESIPAFAISHMPSKCPHTTHLAKWRSHRQQLVLREMRRQPININIGGPSLRIHSEIRIGARCIQLSLLPAGNSILNGRHTIRRTLRIGVEEEGSAGLGMGLSVEIDLREWDG